MIPHIQYKNTSKCNYKSEIDQILCHRNFQSPILGIPTEIYTIYRTVTMVTVPFTDSVDMFCVPSKILVHDKEARDVGGCPPVKSSIAYRG